VFICDNCLTEHYENGPSIMNSEGRCEICGQHAICNDIPTHALRRRSRFEPEGVSRIQLIFEGADEDPPERPTSEQVLANLEQNQVMRVLAHDLSRTLPQVEDSRIRLLFEQDPQQQLSPLGDTYRIFLMGESDTDEECLRALIYQHGPVFKNIRTVETRFSPLTDGISPLVFMIGAFENLAVHTGLRGRYNEVINQVLMTSYPGSPDLSASYKTPDEWIMDQVARMSSQQKYPEAWRTFLDELVTKLDRSGDLPRGGMLCVLLRAGYEIRMDYSQLLRGLEKMWHPRVVYILQIREQLLKMCLTASYAKRFGGRRISDEVARMADHNAHMDMMRYTRLYHYAPREPDPEERVDRIPGLGRPRLSDDWER